MGDWPERFVYVCAATRGAITGVAPLAHAGLERIPRIEVLLGGATRSADAGEAAGPHRDFRRVVELLAGPGAPAPVVMTHVGHPDHPARWSAVLSEVCARAAAEGLPVVFNVTGGTKLMTVGGMLGCVGQARLLHVDAKVRARFVEDPDRTVLPARGELDLDQYLACYGLERADKAESDRRNAFIRDHAEPLRSFANFMMTNRSAAGDLNHLKSGFLPSGRTFVGPKTVAWAVVDPRRQKMRPALARLASEIDGLVVTDIDITIENELVFAIVLQGAWLEGAIYNHIAGRLGNHPGAQLDAHVVLRELGDGLDDTELDVVLMAGSQLHVFEAKSGADGDPKWLQQGEHWRSRLLGRFSENVVVSVGSSAAARASFAKRASRANIRLLAGETAAVIADLNGVVDRILRETAPRTDRV